MARYDEEGFKYGARRDGTPRGKPGHKSSDTAAPAGRLGGIASGKARGSAARGRVRDIVAEAAEAGETVSTGQVVDKFMEAEERAGRNPKRSNVQRNVSKVLGKLEAAGELESRELDTFDRWDHPGGRPGGKLFVWSTRKPEPERTADPMTWRQRPAEETRAKPEASQDQPQGRKPDMFDRAAQRHKDYLAEQAAKAPDNRGRTRPGWRGGRASGQAEPAQSGVDRQRDKWEQRMAAERARSEGKPSPKGGKDEGGGAGVFKKV